MWVVTAGDCFRWFGLAVKGGKVMATLNNQDACKTFKSASVERNVWYKLAASLDLEGRCVQVWLDGVALELWELGPDFELHVVKWAAVGALPICVGGNILGAVPSPDPSFDRHFTTTNYSNGIAFHGLIRDLRIYGRPHPMVQAVTLHVKAVEAERLETVCLGMGGNELAKFSLLPNAKVSDVRAELTEQKRVSFVQEKPVFQFVDANAAAVLADDVQLALLARSDA